MCGPRCHVFCGGRRECQSRNCVEGCFCDSDMVELGETCVRPEDCPVPGTCTSYHNPPPHTIIPLYTVAYERGYIFKAYLNQCSHVATESTTAPPSPSSSINNTTLVCPAGKIHTMCGPRCHVFCGGRRECQSRNCVEGCFCDSDMVELGETCVRPEDCPVLGTMYYQFVAYTLPLTQSYPCTQ